MRPNAVVQGRAGTTPAKHEAAVSRVPCNHLLCGILLRTALVSDCLLATWSVVRTMSLITRARRSWACVDAAVNASRVACGAYWGIAEAWW
jgi:hypothetical protein